MNSHVIKLFPKGITPGATIPYAHKGDWAVHELLPFFYEEIGAFRLSIASFNISEDSLRPIFFMRDRGELLSARFLFDHNVQRHKIDMMFFAGNVADEVRSAQTHMKMMLCENDNASIAVVGSANMNLNRRHECGIVAIDNELFDFYKEYWEDVFNNEAIPFYGFDD